jgi:septal ring-binding cell division protein DamX
MSEKGSSKADTLVKVSMVFFISLLSFSVGTFVGKQVSDSDHLRMKLEGEYRGGGDRQAASTESAAATDKVSEKEVENLTEEFVNKEKSAAATVSAQKDDASDKSGQKMDKQAKRGKAAEVNEVAEKVAKAKAPADSASEARKPSSTLPSVANSAAGKYTVQVASYADEKEAQNHVAELKGKGWNSFYFPANVQGKTWYRVSVGVFDNMKNAREFSVQFMKDANTKAAIVQKIVQ